MFPWKTTSFWIFFWILSWICPVFKIGVGVDYVYQKQNISQLLAHFCVTEQWTVIWWYCYQQLSVSTSAVSWTQMLSLHKILWIQVPFICQQQCHKVWNCTTFCGSYIACSHGALLNRRRDIWRATIKRGGKPRCGITPLYTSHILIMLAQRELPILWDNNLDWKDPKEVKGTDCGGLQGPASNEKGNPCVGIEIYW